MNFTLGKLRSLAKSLYAESSEIIAHDSEVTRSTWSAKVETGKAVEILSLCFLAASAIRLGEKVSIPEIFINKPDLFYLRNVLPRHHGAQPGHEGVIGDISLQDRFVAALTPRLVIKTEESSFGVYREGFPVHLIQTLKEGGMEYLDRPDILVVEGIVDVHDWTKGEVGFSYACSVGGCDGVLRVKNDINLPLKSYRERFRSGIPTTGIIECSVGKGRERAEEQLERYLELFSSDNPPVTLLVNGKNRHCLAYDIESHINLNSDDIEGLCDSVFPCMEAFLGKALASLQI